MIEIKFDGNLEDLLRLVLINEGCWNPQVVDGKDRPRNVNQKDPVDVHSVTNAIDERIYSKKCIVNQLGKYDFSSGSIVNNFKDRQLFSF